MSSRIFHGVVLVALLVLIIFWVAISSVSNIDAETDTAPTIIVSDRNFLPYIRGLKQGPTATATLPPATKTPWVTNTHTPTATPTATIDPAATASSTPTATATNEFQLPKPTLYTIDNGNRDGNYTVAWSSVSGANRYLLKENFNDTTWETIYDGPALSIDRSNMAPGEYCYNVRAFGPSGRSDWAGEKCTIVEKQPEPEYVCEFETLYEGPRTNWSDLELLYDGRLFITSSSEEGATIFDPRTRNFTTVALPDGGGRYAAVLYDGNVLLTVEGNDPYSMIYNPGNEDVAIVEGAVDCLENYRIARRADLVTFCGDDNHGYILEHIYGGGTLFPGKYFLENERVQYGKTFLIPQYLDWADLTLITNGIAGDFLVYDDEYYQEVWSAFDNSNQFSPPDGAISALSYDKSTIYFSGGTEWVTDTPNYTTVKDAHTVDLENYTFKRIVDMWQDRFGHPSIGLSDGSLAVLGGIDWDEDGLTARKLSGIEIFDPSTNKWYKAGSLNIARGWHEAIQLLNGEIFVYGGYADPGPGYSHVAPPEIGRCERMN